MDKKVSTQPNLLWIFGDQHRGQALSLAGDPNVRTPNIDSLALAGHWLPNAIAGFPLCSPCRGSLLTGQYPHQCVPGHEYPMDPNTKTLAHAFRNAGYHTAYFGKWHVDGYHESEGRAAFHTVLPHRRGGFDYWLGYENNNSPWDCWVHGGDRVSGKDIEPFRLEGFETDGMTDIFIDYLNQLSQNPDQPFFAALSVQPPHNPYVAPRQFMDRHNPAAVQLRSNVPNIQEVQSQARRELAGYYALIENLDWNLGRIMDCLDKTGLIDTTRILFFSDHGDMHGSHGQFRKTTAYQEALSIPCVIGQLGRYNPHQNLSIIPVPMNHVDFAPTSLGLCGIGVPDEMQGTDYSDLFMETPSGKVTGKTPYPNSAYIQSVVPPLHRDTIDKPYRGVITHDRWKYVCFEDMDWLLFNLADDPYEQMNLAHNPRYKAKREALRKETAMWVIKTGDSFKVPGQ